jgi:hypothetical protein
MKPMPSLPPTLGGPAKPSRLVTEDDIREGLDRLVEKAKSKDRIVGGKIAIMAARVSDESEKQ